MKQFSETSLFVMYRANGRKRKKRKCQQEAAGHIGVKLLQKAIWTKKARLLVAKKAVNEFLAENGLVLLAIN